MDARRTPAVTSRRYRQGDGLHAQAPVHLQPLLDGGRICLSNNAAERRRAGLFAGSDRGGERAAAIYSLIATAKLNGIDPQAWLADVLRRIADYPASRLHELLPWHWIKPEHQAAAA
jgi:hypothetical protein